ncbi:hypothetical protein A7P95_04995 [Eikenella longinqua]|uniref:Uncharacterized protein n=1 Tax=Eikenella longinqua TaxID=1795827 RepID=A0A1A9RZ21_9NEIS|nr:hypothetical protein A7P95_04995 [Eikenella longinqua]
MAVILCAFVCGFQVAFSFAVSGYLKVLVQISKLRGLLAPAILCLQFKQRFAVFILAFDFQVAFPASIEAT